MRSALEVEKRVELRANAGDVLLDMLGREQRTLAVLPLGSPMRPVPPPTRAIGAWPARCRCASAMQRQQTADVKTGCSGIESDVAGDRLSGASASRDAFGGVVDQDRATSNSP